MNCKVFDEDTRAMWNMFFFTECLFVQQLQGFCKTVSVNTLLSTLKVMDRLQIAHVLLSEFNLWISAWTRLMLEAKLGDDPSAVQQKRFKKVVLEQHSAILSSGLDRKSVGLHSHAPAWAILKTHVLFVALLNHCTVCFPICPWFIRFLQYR